jgi:protein phosphatase
MGLGESGDAGHLVAVADGMGGHAGGQVASSIAIAALEKVVEGAKGTASWASHLRTAYENANREILRTADANPALLDMGTTMVAAIVHDGHATVANLGDSRAYLARRGVIGQITVDHSWREEARRLDLSPEEIAWSPFRETITRSLGVDESVELDIVEIDLAPGDRMVLCSDGIHDLLTDLDILRVIASDETPEWITRRLVDLANDAGGHDNSTCVLIGYDGPVVSGASADTQRGAIRG